jgi:hypothetical protein
MGMQFPHFFVGKITKISGKKEEEPNSSYQIN